MNNEYYFLYENGLLLKKAELIEGRFMQRCLKIDLFLDFALNHEVFEISPGDFSKSYP